MMLLNECSNLKIMLSSRVSIGSPLEDCTEKIFDLSTLSSQDASILFLKKSPRKIAPDEFQEFSEFEKQNQIQLK